VIKRSLLAIVLGSLGADIETPVRAQAQPAANPVQTVLQLDSNGDMVLERDEVPESGQAAFDRLLKLGDANKNGKLEADEIRAMAVKLRRARGAGLAGPARFKALDKDGDGKLSREEFPGPPAQFARIDADNDGFISQEEAARAVASGPGGPAPKAKAAKKAD
jgi:hypothetical protein